MTPAELDRYLSRIAYSAPRAPTLETLRALHLAHLRTVPFENLSVRCGEPIVLDEQALFEKVVARRRGGFCYELNGLFAALLDALGFRVARLAGVVREGGIPFDHMALRVDLDEPWLADVGFGDSFLAPLRLETRGPQDGGDGRPYRLSDADGGLLLAREKDGAWERQYAFTLDEWPLGAYADGCRYHSSSPRSSFTQRTIVSRASEGGRVTVADRKLIVTERGVKTEEELPDDAAVARVLEQRFGIVLGGGGG